MPRDEQPSPLDPFLDLPEFLPKLSRRDFDLTQEQVDRLRSILERESGKKPTNEQAWEAARNLIRFAVLLLDLSVEQERTKAGLPPRSDGVTPMAPLPPPPPPEPQPFPIRLDADHAYEVESNLRMLEYELGRVKTFPSSWRWAVVAAYNALGHALAMRHSVPAQNPFHHLLELFDVAADEMHPIRQMRAAVEQLELMRTTWLARPVGEWPITQNDLAETIPDCLRAAGEIEPATSASPTLERLVAILTRIRDTRLS